MSVPACILLNSFLLLQRSSGDDSSTGGDSEENEGKDKEVSDFDIHSEAKSLQKVTNYTTTSLNKKPIKCQSEEIFHFSHVCYFVNYF